MIYSSKTQKKYIQVSSQPKFLFSRENLCATKYRPWSSSVMETGTQEHKLRKENRLAKEKSPYLLQHKSNPVDWYPWGEEAIERAKAENKPIFLSVGYSTCQYITLFTYLLQLVSCYGS
jgi:hypothetical protein